MSDHIANVSKKVGAKRKRDISSTEGADVKPKAEHTPTPWSIRLVERYETAVTDVYEVFSGDTEIMSDQTYYNRALDRSTAEFIVEAVNAYEKLKAENDSLRSSNAALRGAASRAIDCLGHETDSDCARISIRKLRDVIAQTESEARP